MVKRGYREKADLNRTIPERTEQVYRCISAYIAEQGIPPTLAELAACAHLSRGGVLRHLDRLEAQGRIRRDFNKKRSIVLIDKKDA
ncbi:MAG: LexA repressor [Chloroflexi bacterium OLB15]|nr:MAG: LexA repressor [Chloroflexi bacterium OLB15]